MEDSVFIKEKTDMNLTRSESLPRRLQRSKESRNVDMLHRLCEMDLEELSVSESVCSVSGKQNVVSVGILEVYVGIDSSSGHNRKNTLTCYHTINFNEINESPTFFSEKAANRMTVNFRKNIIDTPKTCKK